MEPNSQLSPADQDALLVKAPLTVLGLGMVYSTALGWLERRYPIKPDHTWAEVAGGVLITLVPVALEARRAPRTDWRTYENAIWRCFVASGTPIVLWQLGESIIRHVELLRYAAKRDRVRSVRDNADSTTTLAHRSRERAEGSAPCGERGDHDLAEGAGDA